MSRELLMVPLMLCSLVVNAQDAAFESPERIRAVARDYAQQQAGTGTQVEATALDERLRLPACAQSPTAFAPQGNNGRGAITRIATNDTRDFILIERRNAVAREHDIVTRFEFQGTLRNIEQVDFVAGDG